MAPSINPQQEKAITQRKQTHHTHTYRYTQTNTRTTKQIVELSKLMNQTSSNTERSVSFEFPSRSISKGLREAGIENSSRSRSMFVCSASGRFPRIEVSIEFSTPVSRAGKRACKEGGKSSALTETARIERKADVTQSRN